MNFNRKTMLWGIGLIILIALIFQYGHLLTGEKAGMQNSSESQPSSEPASTTGAEPAASSSTNGSSEYSSQSALSGNDLLPSSSNNEFGNLNPNNGVVMPDMLQAGMLNSLEGISQTKKNTSLDLRGDVAIPRSDGGLSNVNISTIEPDQMRRKFEIGCVA